MPAVGKARRCVDCGGSGDRPAPFPGPRCWSHDRSHKADQKARRRDAHLGDRYGISEADYAALYRAQGGKCAGCRRATGRVKRLAVDHDHGCTEGHPAEFGCRACVRGLLCGPCNEELGRHRDSPVSLIRLGLYLVRPPAAAVLRPGAGELTDPDCGLYSGWTPAGE